MKPRSTALSAALICLFLISNTGVADACSTHFSYDASASPATEVLLSGTFNGWATTPPDVWVLSDDDHDQIWELTVDLPIDTYLYKFIVDGVWLQDPANPETDPDGFGGYNSVLSVECDEPEFSVDSYYLNESAGAFTASLSFTPGETGAELDADSVSVSLDYVDLPPAAWHVTGNHIQVNVSGLTNGIHDIRVTASDQTGVPVRTQLLKAYIGYSTDWRDSIMYFAMTDRFNNGDPTNDAPVSGLPDSTNYRGGDLQGILDKINAGYFDALGVDTIWISWPGDNPDEAEWGCYFDTDDCNIPPGGGGYPETDVQFSGYHGYWPRYLKEVDEHFGTMDTLKNLVLAAHQRGIKILLDLTVNHVHDTSPFYIDHPESYFNMNPIEICEDIGWSHPETCWFTEFLPDIRYQDPRAVRDVLRMASWWVEQTGCDGFRVDALKHIAFEFISALREEMDRRFSQTGVDFYLVGETFSGNPYDLTPFIGEDLVHGEFDFPLNLHILKAFGTEESGLSDLYSNTRSFKSTYRSTWSDAVMANFIGNHDIARFLSLAAGDLYCGVWDNLSHMSQGWRHPPDTPDEELPYRKLRLALTYLFTLPDIPMIYYGDELGLPGANDPDNRRFMLFDSALNSRQAATLSYTQLLGSIRRAHTALAHADLGPALFADTTFLAFPRVTETERIIVALNRSTMQRTETFDVSTMGLHDGDTLTDAVSGHQITVTGQSVQITLDGYQGAIYCLELPTPTPTTPPTQVPTMTPTSLPGTPTPTPPPPTATMTPTKTPTPPDTNRSIEIHVNHTEITAGQTFSLTRTIQNGAYPVTASVYTLLDVYGYYYFWPGWSEEIDYRTMNLDANCHIQETLLSFEWPDGAGSGAATFWAAMFAPMTWDLLADIDSCSFEWR